MINSSNNKIDVLLASDENYSLPLLVTLTSILENNISNNFIYFHIINNNISENKINEIRKLENKYNCKINLYKFDINKLKDYPIYGHLTNTAYLRLFIHNILPENIDKLIYLDCDIVCLKDIELLYKQDLNNFPVAAVKDVKSKELLRLKHFSNISKYFNSGVMLINFPLWRKFVNANTVSEILKNQNNIICDADQEILNKIFTNNWKELKPKYNLDIKHKVFKKVPKNTILLHYSDKIKPWNYVYPYNNKKYFFKYLKISNQSIKSSNSFSVFIKKHKLYIINIIKNIIRPITPRKVLDLNKNKFFKSRFK
jgi:lipopolysaccharide biosynthesis glycosyltransferase